MNATMKYILAVLLAAAVAFRGTACPAADVSTSIADVKRRCISESPQPQTSVIVHREYVGPGLELLERKCVQMRSDTYSKIAWRVSLDNGETWSSPWQQADTTVHHGGVEFFEGFSPMFHDPQSGRLVAIWLRQTSHKGRYFNFCYSRVSTDLGRSWSEPKQLRYEPGDDFDPGDPLAPGFLEKNHAYYGSNIIRHTSGTLIHCVAHANVPGDPLNSQRAWRMGSLCFIGQWDAAAGDYRWRPGRRVEISPRLSARGLMEPELAELEDGRVLVVWRGSNTDATPGRKWFSISSDGGQTLAPVEELKYDDGSRFYSPSSYHRMIRHSQTGKLYWVGNICPDPPNKNSPRYPLVIAEVDEREPSLRRRTLCVIDDRRPGDAARLQLSNFSVIENRQTHAIEIYLTRLGADPDDFWKSHAYQYTLTPGK